MSPLIDLAHDDDIVAELLAPLARVQPVTLPHPRRGRHSRRRLAVGVAIAAAILLVGGLALAGAFGPLHDAILTPNTPTLPSTEASELVCRLIGQPAGKAETALRQHGYQIEWRFQHWGSQTSRNGNDRTTPGAVTGGYTSTPATVPPDSIVWDITPDQRSPNTLFVFVQAANDPNAPTITPPACRD